MDDEATALDRAVHHARAWRASLADRPVPARVDTDTMVTRFGGSLPAAGIPAAEVVDRLGRDGADGLLAIGSGRFFGWVMGGTLPAALAADWLVSAWDQNAGMRGPTPTVAALEEVAAGWLLDLLGLPPGADVGFTTGATMANFTGLAAGRDEVLRRAGWDVLADGLAGAPRVRVLVGEERHDTVDLALRYLGLGRPTPLAVDDQGRLRADALADALAALPPGAPAIVVLQAGNLHSGAHDPFPAAIEVAHRQGAWVHVDGAFGLWAAAAPTLAHLTAGVAAADSWATDAHKTLNVPYDCGVAVVADRAAMRRSFDVHTSYLPEEPDGPGHPYEKVPELSRRARGVPTWAALRSLGRDGVAELVETLALRARELAAGIGAVPGAEVLNDVVATQVCVAFGSDARTRAVTDRVLTDGDTWMSGSRWRGRAVLRVSVSNAATTAEDVRRAVAAVTRAAAAVPG